jgi:CheY-like chemotaxis protein
MPRDRRPSVLVVEHIRATRELMALVLRGRYRVQTADTYAQALRRVQATRYDGVLMSVTLQGLQAGVEAITAVRARAGYAAIPLIVVIGPSLENVRGRLEAAGGDAFLRMPFGRTDLLGTLRDALPEPRSKRRT